MGAAPPVRGYHREARRAVEVRAAPAAAGGPAGSPEQVSETGPILIIEDDADTRQVFRDVLEARGYSVATAANGREGLDRLAMAPRPCLILVDLMMPVMDGLEFLQRFQTTEHAGRIPVLVVSAYHDMAARAEGADGFVEKPLQLDRLVDLVRDYCGPAD